LVDALKSNLSFSITNLDNKELKIFINDIISPSYEKVIKNEGLPKNNGGKGDLIIKFDIKFPNKLSDEQKNF